MQPKGIDFNEEGPANNHRTIAEFWFFFTWVALFIITKAADILRTEPNLLEVEAPITGKLLPLDPCQLRY